MAYMKTKRGGGNMFSLSEQAGSLLVFFVIIAAIFFACRALLLWYWRINEAVDLLKQINKKLDRLPRTEQDAEAAVASPPMKKMLRPGDF